MMESKNTSKTFNDAISKYLKEEAIKDPMFAERFANPDKSIEECCDFIVSQVRKSNICGFADEEIYGLAKHYYDEDDLGDIERCQCKVVVNHVVELTEEEKETARKVAFEREVSAQQEKLKPRKPKMQVQQEEQQLFLF